MVLRVLPLYFPFLFAALVIQPAFADRLFGIERELASVDRIETPGAVPIQRHIHMLELVKKALGGGGSEITTEPWEKNIALRKAVYRDAEGGIWQVVPEHLTDKGHDGFELISPPHSVERGAHALPRILSAVESTGEYGKGIKSSNHVTFDVSDCIQPDGNASKLVELILFIEGHWPEIYASVSPKRYGSIVNDNAVPLSYDHPDLLQELAALKPAERTFDRVSAIFWKHAPGPSEGPDAMAEFWKFRAASYAKIFGWPTGSRKRHLLEIRIPDLIESEVLEKQVKLLAAVIDQGAKQGASLSFQNPFKECTIDKKDFEEINERIYALPEEQHRAFVRSLKLNPDDYRRFGRLNGPPTAGLPRTRLTELEARSDLSQTQFSLSTRFIGEKARHHGSFRKWEDMLESARRLERAENEKKAHFDLSITIPEETLKPIPSSALKNWLSRVSDTIVLGNGFYENTTPLRLERKHGITTLHLQITGTRTLESIGKRVMLGLLNPKLIIHSQAGKMQRRPLVSLMESWTQRYHQRQLTPEERRFLGWLERQGSPHPLYDWKKAEFLSEVEKENIFSKETLFLEKIFTLMQSSGTPARKVNEYRNAFSSWIFWTSADQIMERTLLLRDDFSPRTVPLSRAGSCILNFMRLDFLPGPEGRLPPHG